MNDDELDTDERLNEIMYSPEYPSE